MRKLSQGEIILRYLTLIAVCGIIFWFSSNNGENSTNQSARIVNILCRIFLPDMNLHSLDYQLAVRDLLSVAVRKGAHFAIYTLLGMLSYMAFFPVKTRFYRCMFSLLFCIAYACTDEIHQLFVPDRTGKIVDVGIDSIGATLGIFLVCAIALILKARNIVKENNSPQ